MWFKYGLKAQKLLAQGIALGIMALGTYLTAEHFDGSVMALNYE